MAFVNGLMLIDAPASALNNAGMDQGARTDNTVAVKSIKTRDGVYPYVSAQAFRYWLRHTLTSRFDRWIASPLTREKKIAYSEADPFTYWDDDLFGFMRAAKGSDKNALTRISPFKTGTLVSIAPTGVVEDFGTMSRHEGNAVPFEHQFYRCCLQGLFSLDINSAGTFWYSTRSGYANIIADTVPPEKREELTEISEPFGGSDVRGLRLPLDRRTERVATLFRGLGELVGGAKLTLHFTDVLPSFAIFVVIKGGNNIFKHVIGHVKSKPVLNVEAMEEALAVYADQIISPVYIGWIKGFMDDQREKLDKIKKPASVELVIEHTRKIFNRFADDVESGQRDEWFD